MVSLVPAGNPRAQASGGAPIPAVEALPAQAARGGQPVAPARPQQGPPARPTPPATRGTATQPAQPRNAEAANRPTVDAAQQVQFDNNGLVTMHTNELDVRQLLELRRTEGPRLAEVVPPLQPRRQLERRRAEVDDLLAGRVVARGVKDA